MYWVLAMTCLAALVVSSNAYQECGTEILICQETYFGAIAEAGQNVTLLCNAGEALFSCLDFQANVPECDAMKQMIEMTKQSFATQIKDNGCTP